MQNDSLDIKSIILSKILDYKNISLFFHENPDFDTLGGCYALREFINDNFSDKTVRIIDVDKLSPDFLNNIFQNFNEKADDDFIKSSLGIVIDTANKNRIFSKKYKYCDFIIKIDHHPEVDSFGHINWTDPIYPAASQMVSELIYFDKNYKVSSNTAKYLYSGILTDTNRFLHYNTLPTTYEMASKLVLTGFDRSIVHNAIYKKEKRELLFSSYIIKKVKIENRIAYTVLPKNIHKKFGARNTNSMVHCLDTLKNVDIWTTLYYDNNKKIWRGSIRSQKIPINVIAEKFNGGGHKFASGFSLKQKKDYKLVINALKEYLKSLENK